MDKTAFKTVLAGVRPPRVVTLLDGNDPHWEHTCLRMIEIYSSVWGGRYNTVVPTDGTTISPAFWKALELYDPDYCFSYAKTCRDLKISDPAAYEELLRKRTEGVASQVHGKAWEELKEDLDRQLQDGEISNFAVSNELQASLRTRLAVFHHEHRSIQSRVYARSSKIWQLTSLSEIIPQCEHADKIAVIEILPTGLEPLWLAALTGAGSDTFLQELTTAGIKKLRVEFTNERLSEVVRLGVKGFHDVVHVSALRMIEGKESATIEDLSQYFPFQLSMAQLALYRPIEATYSDEPRVVIVGETFDDFAYYLCLSRLRPNVSWLLPSWVKKHKAGLERVRGTEEKLTPEESIIYYYSLALRDPMAPGRGRCMFASLSLCKDEVTGLIKDLAKAGVLDPEGFQSQAEARSAIDVLPTHAQIAFERDNISRSTALQFVDKELPGWFETPKPRNFYKIDPSKFRWITEISIKGHSVPRHPALGPHVIRDSRFGSLGVRAGRNGVAYYCPNMMVLHGIDVDQLLVRPRLYLPEALDIFQAIAGANGYRCTPSQKGVFAEETTRKFGGLSALAEFLRKPSGGKLLDKYLDTKRPAEGEHDDGVLLASDRRRYLDLASIQKIIDTSEDTLSLIDELVVKGVFHRGFIFKCRLCRNADWFFVGEVSSQFKRKRCGLEQTYVRAHSLRDAEPSWFYKLDELVSCHRNK